MILGDNFTPKTISTPSAHDELQKRLFKILEATTDVVAMADCDGLLLYLNEAGRRLFGWDKEDGARCRHTVDIHPGWAYEVVKNEAFPAALKDGAWSGETALTVQGGRELPVLQVVLAHAGAGGAVEFYSMICRDISDRKLKELEQIEWANRYDAAIRASGQVLFDWNSKSGAITYGGDVEKLLGYSGSEMQGGLARLRELIHPEDIDAFDLQIARVTETRDPFHHEFRVFKKNGKLIIIEAQGFFFLDRSGQIGRMVGFLRDVTSERSAERMIQLANEKLERHVAERTAALEKAYGELEHRARQQAAVARLSHRALANHDLHTLMQEAAEIVCANLDVQFGAVLELETNSQQFTVHGSHGWPENLADSPIRSGCLSQSGYAVETGGAVISPDFSRENRFSISQKLRQSRASSGVSVCIQGAERPLGVLNAFSLTVRSYSAEEVSFMQAIANVLTSALERRRAEEKILNAQTEAESANKAKSDFLSRMSHELRTPLNSILGFTQLMEMEENNARQTESIEHVSRAGQNLLVMINEILDIARLDSGRAEFTFDTLDLAEILPSIVTLSDPLAQRHNVKLLPVIAPAASACIRTDRERLRQILLNLLSNAVKYNRPGGTVEVSVGQPVAGFWRISVRDTGAGLSETQLARLFVPFERLGVREGGTAGGTGLGLSLCQRLAKALNGHIGVQSTVGEGSTFWVEFPQAEMEPLTAPLQPSPEPTIAAAIPASPGETLILYIEDDVANAQLLERLIAVRKGTKLLTAVEGRSGFDLAREHRPNVILLDLNLPDVQGDQLLLLLKADPVTANIPVIVVSGEVADDLEEKLCKSGALGLLVKPYRVQDLFTMLDRALGK